MDNYVKHYNDHYLNVGESGSGQLVWEPQYEMWLKAGFKPSMSVLDYGCGVGVMLESGVKDYLGVDISSEALRLAQKRYPDAEFILMNPGELKAEPRDFLCAQSVFTHTPKAAVQKCLDNISTLFKKFAVIDVFFGEDQPLDLHVRYFTPEEWQESLWKARLKGEYLGSHDFAGYDHQYFKVTHG